MFSLEELQKMNKNELITIIGNYLSDQEIWLNKVKELEKQNDKKSAEIERLTKERDGYLDDRFAVCHALREMKKGNAELQKQVDELKEEKLSAVCDLNMRIIELDNELKQAVKDTVEEMYDFIHALLCRNIKHIDTVGFKSIFDEMLEYLKNKGVGVE